MKYDSLYCYNLSCLDIYAFVDLSIRPVSDTVQSPVTTTKNRSLSLLKVRLHIRGYVICFSPGNSSLNNT